MMGCIMKLFCRMKTISKSDCSHVWVYYYSTQTRQCIDCKRVQEAKDWDGLTAHKRKSGVGP